MQFNVIFDMGKKDKRTIVIAALNLHDASEWGRKQLAQWKKEGHWYAEPISETPVDDKQTQ